MAEPSRVTREEIQALLDTIARGGDISPEDDKELGDALAAMEALLEPGWNWYVCPKCPFCGQTAVIALPTEGVEKMVAGEHPQYAFPGISASKRELAKTGIHPECWDKYLPKPED
jgi:hypothetical protein